MADDIRLLIDRIGTPIGELAIVADTEGRLRAVEWSDHEARLQRSLRLYCGGQEFSLHLARNPGGLSAAIRAYFDGELNAIDDLPTVTSGTAFQRKVWHALRQIPCGETLTYGILAQRIGHAAAVRAVGHANGANPISVIVPCHRVISSDGSLTGYGGGITRKRWLLAHERRATCAELPLSA